MADFSDRYVNSDGIRTRYWCTGSGDTTLVLLHGLGGTVEDWAETMPSLAQGRRVFAFDLLGCGETGKPADCSYTPDDMRRHTVATLDALGLGKVDINGWSLGGRIALEVAHEAPARLRRLVLTAPAGIGEDTILKLDAPWRDLLGQIATRPTESGLRMIRNAAQNKSALRLLKFAARRVSLVTDTAARTAFLRQLQSFVGTGGYLAEPRRALLEKLPLITVPSCAIWGKEDNFAPYSHSLALETLMPDYRVVGFADCGHAPHIEYPEKYTQALCDFLDSP